MDRVALTPDLSFSRLVYGMWRLGDDADTSPRHVQAKVEACLEHGITTMDQADIYGGYTAEALLGAAFAQAPGLRDRVEIVTKCGIVAPVGRHADARVKHYDTSAAHVTAAVERSLADMRTDRVDLLLIHRPDPFMDADETGRALDALVASGKVRAVGVSNFSTADLSLLQSAMASRLVTNQIELSVLHPAPFLDGAVQGLQERRLPVMAWSPLGGGALFGTRGAPVRAVLARLGAARGAEAAAVALAWLLAHPARILPVIGTNAPARIAALSQATQIALSRQDWFEVLAAATGRDVP